MTDQPAQPLAAEPGPIPTGTLDFAEALEHLRRLLSDPVAVLVQQLADAHGPTDALRALLRGDDAAARGFLEAVSDARLRDTADAADHLSGLADSVRFDRSRGPELDEAAAAGRAEETPA